MHCWQVALALTLTLTLPLTRSRWPAGSAGCAPLQLGPTLGLLSYPLVLGLGSGLGLGLGLGLGSGSGSGLGSGSGSGSRRGPGGGGLLGGEERLELRRVHLDAVRLGWG